MSQRPGYAADFRSILRQLGRLQAGRRRPSRCRPGLEPLEGRALMSVGGMPDYSYGGISTIADYRPGVVQPRFYQGTTLDTESLVQGEAVQADGKVLVVGFENIIAGFNTPSGQQIISVARLNADGTVDTTFGTGGSVNLPGPSAGYDVGTAVAVQADGKILVLGDLAPTGGNAQVALTRLNTNGSVDTTFGTGGAVDFNFDQGTTPLASTATKLAVDANGKIVVGGLAATSGAALARFNANGTPDTSFGTSGQVLLSFAGASDTQGVAGLAIRPDGEIVLDTTINPGSGTTTQIALATLKADGTPDNSFGTAGQLPLPGSTDDTAAGLAIQADGKIVVAGAYFNLTNDIATTHFDAFRLSPAGIPDANFGADGEASLDINVGDISNDHIGLMDTDIARAVVIQPDGKIEVGGEEYSGTNSIFATPTVVRFNADGTPDLTLGIGGVASPNVGGEFSSGNSVPHSIYDLVVGLNGQVLAASDIGVARLLTTGAPNDFDNDGKTDLAISIPSMNLFAYRPSSGGADVLIPFGSPGSGNTLPAPGTYHGGGVDTLGVYLPNLGTFAVKDTTTANNYYYAIGPVGLGQAIPAPADYAGIGITQLGVYVPSTGSFVYQTGSSTTTVPFGTPGVGGSIPVPADYDGSGRDELGVYLPALGAFAYRPADGGPDVIIPFGTPGAGNSIPVPGDYDGSGHTELAVYLPALGAFAYRPYGGGPDVIVPFGTPGVGGSLPAPGDYDGSGHLELGVYLPALGAFAYRPADGGPDVIIPFGTPGAGVSIPFETISVTDGAFDTSSGGGGGSAAGIASGGGSGSYLDFVPDLAGSKKGKGSNSGLAGG